MRAQQQRQQQKSSAYTTQRWRLERFLIWIDCKQRSVGEEEDQEKVSIAELPTEGYDDLRLHIRYSLDEGKIRYNFS